MARHGTVMEWYRIELNKAVKEKNGPVKIRKDSIAAEVNYVEAKRFEK